VDCGEGSEGGGVVVCKEGKGGRGRSVGVCCGSPGPGRTRSPGRAWPPGSAPRGASTAGTPGRRLTCPWQGTRGAECPPEAPRAERTRGWRAQQALRWWPPWCPLPAAPICLQLGAVCAFHLPPSTGSRRAGTSAPAPSPGVVGRKAGAPVDVPRGDCQAAFLRRRFDASVSRKALDWIRVSEQRRPNGGWLQNCWVPWQGWCTAVAPAGASCFQRPRLAAVGCCLTRARRAAVSRRATGSISATVVWAHRLAHGFEAGREVGPAVPVVQSALAILRRALAPASALSRTPYYQPSRLCVSRTGRASACSSREEVFLTAAWERGDDRIGVRSRGATGMGNPLEGASDSLPILQRPYPTHAPFLASPSLTPKALSQRGSEGGVRLLGRARLPSGAT